MLVMRHLHRLFDPDAIAIVGLSADPDKHGHRVLRHLQAHGYGGQIWGVNPKLPAVDDIPVFASVAALPAPPDVLVLAVPAAATPDVVAAAAGAGVAIVFAGGFAESGDAGAAVQEELRLAATTSGVRLLGPNSGGVIRPGLPMSFLTCLDRPAAEIRGGPVGLVTQSGGIGSYLHNLAAERETGLAASISTGNEIDVDIADGIVALADRADVSVVAVVMETVRRGDAFVAAVADAHRAGKRVVVARFGTSEHGGSLLETHTAALARPHRVLDGVLWSLGVPIATTPAELLDVSEIVARCGDQPVESVGIVAHSGGVAILLADLCEHYGVELPPPSDALVADIAPLLDQGTVGNPIDMGGIIGGPGRFAEVVARFGREYQAVLAVSSAHPPAHAAERVTSLLELNTPAQVIHLWMAGDVAAGPLHRLRRAGRPVTEEPRAAVRALAALVTQPQRPTRAIRRPSSASRVADGPAPSVADRDAMHVLASWGIAAVEQRRIATGDDSRRDAAEIGFPVVVKADAPDLIHKTEAGAVVVDVRTSVELARAVEAVTTGAVSAGFSPTGVVIEPLVTGVEVLAAAIRDETFGPMVTVGLGGIFAEALDATVMALAPLSTERARRLIDRIPGRHVLTAPRAGTPADLDGLADIVAALGHRLAADPELSAIEINPLTWTAAGWVAVDAVMH